MTTLIDALGAHRGVVCAVGAGGKKSVLYQLAREHPGRFALTATVHTTTFPDDLPAEQVIDDCAALRERVLSVDASRSVAYACPSTKPGRYAGVATDAICTLHEGGGFAATFVKADGARMRWIKSPAAGEPLLPDGADLVIPVVSARAIGEPLSERVAHRLDRVAAITGVAPGETLTPEAVGRLLASDDGALKGTSGRHKGTRGVRVAPVINMVDNDFQEESARAAAEAAIAMTSRFDSVVLCCLRRPGRPVVTVVVR
jgi:probable selenium-dependent hydroxylase accessory protein YqeC